MFEPGTGLSINQTEKNEILFKPTYSKVKKDIPNRKVENIAIAIVPPGEELGEDELWDVYLINLKEVSLINVLITSKGYGYREGERVETSTLRYFYEEIGPLHYTKIEPIQVELFDLANEYWLSFSLDGHMYDKKYLFVSGSIHKNHFTMIPFLNKQGVMIR